MGIKLFSDSAPYVSPNPDPRRFRVLKTTHRNGYTCAEVEYPDCTTHEGVKILVYEGNVTYRLQSAMHLDPHFLESGDLVPVARFAPTKKGRALAKLLLDHGGKGD